MGDLAASLNHVILGLGDNPVRGVLVLKPNDGRCGLVDSEHTGDGREGCDEKSREAHVGGLC